MTREIMRYMYEVIGIHKIFVLQSVQSHRYFWKTGRFL